MTEKTWRGLLPHGDGPQAAWAADLLPGLGMELTTSKTLAAMMGVAARAWTIQAVASHASLAQWEAWAPRLSAGAACATAIAEPHSGTDLQALRTRWAGEPGRKRLNGQKQNISHGCSATFLLCIAATDDGSALLLLDGAAHPWEGTPSPQMIGMEGLSTCDIAFRDLPVGEFHRLAPAAPGLETLGHVMTFGRAWVALGAASVLRQHIQASMAFAEERLSGGKPIAQQQHVQHHLTEAQRHCTQMEALGKACLQAVGAGDAAATGLGNVAKLATGEGLSQAARHLLAVWGTAGYRSGPIGDFARDALAFQTVAGTEESHRISLFKQMRKGLI